MNKVSKGLKKLKEVENLIDDYKDEYDPEAAGCIADKLVEKAEWLLDRLLDFMQISANMDLNQKDNDEAILYRMALESARNKIFKDE